MGEEPPQYEEEEPLEEEDKIQHHDLLTEFRIALNNMSFNATMNLVFLGVLVFFMFFSKWLRYSIFLTST